MEAIIYYVVLVGSAVANMLYKSKQILLDSFFAAVFRSWLVSPVSKMPCM